jgi:hypothetical protein
VLSLCEPEVRFVVVSRQIVMNKLDSIIFIYIDLTIISSSNLCLQRIQDMVSGASAAWKNDWATKASCSGGPSENAFVISESCGVGERRSSRPCQDPSEPK